MKTAKSSSVEALQTVGRFESLRRTLSADAYAAHRLKTLAYWALPSDRRLPLAFLGRTLEELLGTPYAELAGTPGIGQKKIRSFIKLLARAAQSEVAEPQIDETAAASAAGNGETHPFDPLAVSEVVWAQWQASAIRSGQGREKLGRLAPSLQNMSRVIWERTLGEYAAMSLADIRRMKTHGEKRIRAILEVFHGVHALTANMGSTQHLAVRIVPRLIDEVETWVVGMLDSESVPSDEEIGRCFVLPLLKQIRIDANRQIAALAENRLGINGPITSVRQAARAMGLTRARVYQLLNEVNDIMNVRWPAGRRLVHELADKLQSEAALSANLPALEHFRAAVELFYPGSRRGMGGAPERAEFHADLCDEQAETAAIDEEAVDEAAEQESASAESHDGLMVS